MVYDTAVRDRYITGRLPPKGTFLPPEEQDASDDQSDDAAVTDGNASGDDGKQASRLTMQPSSIGMSFTVDKAVENGMTSVAASAAAAVAAAIAQSAAYLILFLLGFALILIAWKLISHALDLVARLPGLHFLNKTCGALFGLVQACVLLFVAAWLLQFFGHVLSESLVNQTHLLKFFMTTNPLSLLSGL